MTEFGRMSAARIAREVASGDTSAVEVAQAALERIRAYDAVQPQAWILKLPEEAVLEQARAVDARVKAGEALPLAGATFAVKDNIDVAGLVTTAACPAFGYRAERSATVVERLLAAGAVLVGKTNLDQFATGLVGTRSPYGAPGCVFNTDYVSGGSSSGSAVAAGAGLVAFALGTDTAGSGRVPAAFNGLVGLKPTKGRWSTRGLVPACRSLDCISVFASSAEDAGLVDEVLTGFDPEDDYSRRAPEPAPLPEVVRIGVPAAGQLNFFGDGQSERLFRAAAAKVASLPGVELVEVDIAPLSAAAQLLYSGPWVAERTAAVETLLKQSPGAIHPVVRAIVQGGLAVSGVDAFKGEYRLKAYARQAEAMWGCVDVLLLPTTPTSYRISELLAEPVALNSNLGAYTNFVNLLDMAAVAAPAGYRDNGTGFGITFIGPAFADRALLQLAARYEAAGLDPLPELDLKERPAMVQIAVVGAHLHGMPLHWQLTSREARLVKQTRTAPVYRLYAMTGTTPMKPALVHAGAAGGGAAIELEVYELGMEAFGSFVAEVPPPLAIGTVTLEDGSEVKGFVAEPRAIEGAEEITALGGWRAFMKGR